MKISSLYIDGFGKFHDWKPSSTFGEGLTAIVGPNEAGKTTLLTFIRRMLYGFPDGRKKDLNHYRPINGGTIGGRLDILGEDGKEYILSRTKIRGIPSLTYTNGTTVKSATLSSLLGPCDQVFYENVCAIGLSELQEFSTLNQEEIKDRLATAGAGNLPVRQVATSLKESADCIYAVRGKTKRINTLVSELRDVEEGIRDVKKRQAEYDPINEEIAQKEKILAEEKERQKTVDEDLAYFRALGQAWEEFVRREEARTTLRTIPEIEPFPDNALEELNRIETEVQKFEEEYEDLTERQNRSRDEIEHCVVRDKVLDQADVIHALERKIERYQSHKDDLKGYQIGLQQKEKERDEVLQNLGEDWNEERVTRFDTSVPTQDDAKQLREHLAETESDFNAQRSPLEVAEKESKEKKEDLKILQRERGEIEESVVRDEILRQADAIHTIERNIARYQSHEDDLEGYQIELQQKERDLARVLQDLGGDWDEERVTRFDTSDFVKDDAKQIRERLAESERTCSTEQSCLDLAEKELREKKEDLRALQRRRDEIGDVPDPDTARRTLLQARELMREIQSAQELEKCLHSVRQEEARTTEIKNSLDLPQSYPSWTGILVVLSAPLVFVLGYLAEMVLFAGVVAVILLIAAGGIFLTGRKGREEPGSQGAVHPYKEEGETLAAQRKEVERERSELEEKIQSHARPLGFAARPSQTEVENLVHTLNDTVVVADRASDLDEEIARAEERCSRADASMKTAQENMRRAEAERKDVLDAWKRWCQERDLPETMNPDLIPDLIAGLRQAAGLYAEISEIKKREKGLAEEIRSFEENLRGIIAACREAAIKSPAAISDNLRCLFDYEERMKGRGERDVLSPDFDTSRKVAEDLVRLLNDAVDKAKKASALDEEIARAEERCNHADASLKTAQEKMQCAEDEREDAQDAWKRWCQERDLPEAMNPDLIPDLIAGIRQAAGLYAEIGEMKKKENGLAEEIRSFEEKVIAVSRACDESLNGSPDVVVEGLIRLLRDEEEAKRRYNKLTEQLKEESEALEKKSAQYDAEKAKLKGILKERDVESVEEYRTIEQVSCERQGLEKSIQDAESAIKKISGEGRYDDFITALQDYDPVRIQAVLQEKEDEQKEIHDIIWEKNWAIGKLIERRSGIEGDQELTSLLSRAAKLEEDINQVSREWAVYTVASGLLEMAVETFERERQPEILREAQSFFTGITDGRYTRMVKPLDGSEFYVEEATGAQKKIDALSRGTAEQLYLALRLGYIRDYATSSSPVPVIFDDILVNFDPIRRKSACQAIADLAETCQVLYFTCHPETVGNLTEVTPDAVVMDLSTM